MTIQDIKAYRKQLRLTQTEFSRAIGASGTLIAHVESGDIKISQKLERKIRDYMRQMQRMTVQEIRDLCRGQIKKGCRGCPLCRGLECAAASVPGFWKVEEWMK